VASFQISTPCIPPASMPWVLAALFQPKEEPSGWLMMG
jgi:hypothetical protein